MALFSLLSLSLWRIKSAPLITIKCFLKKQSASEGIWPWAHYNLPYTNAFLGTINFLQYTPKFSVFKLKRCKRVPHHIAFLSSSMFWGGKKILRIQEKQWKPFIVRERDVCQNDTIKIPSSDKTFYRGSWSNSLFKDGL